MNVMVGYLPLKNRCGIFGDEKDELLGPPKPLQLFIERFSAQKIDVNSCPQKTKQQTLLSKSSTQSQCFRPSKFEDIMNKIGCIDKSLNETRTARNIQKPSVKLPPLIFDGTASDVLYDLPFCGIEAPRPLANQMTGTTSHLDHVHSHEEILPVFDRKQIGPNSGSLVFTPSSKPAAPPPPPPPPPPPIFQVHSKSKPVKNWEIRPKSEKEKPKNKTATDSQRSSVEYPEQKSVADIRHFLEKKLKPCIPDTSVNGISESVVPNSSSHDSYRFQNLVDPLRLDTENLQDKYAQRQYEEFKQSDPNAKRFYSVRYEQDMNSNRRHPSRHNLLRSDSLNDADIRITSRFEFSTTDPNGPAFKTSSLSELPSQSKLDEDEKINKINCQKGAIIVTRTKYYPPQTSKICRRNADEHSANIYKGNEYLSKQINSDQCNGSCNSMDQKLGDKSFYEKYLPNYNLPKINDWNCKKKLDSSLLTEFEELNRLEKQLLSIQNDLLNHRIKNAYRDSSKVEIERKFDDKPEASSLTNTKSVRFANGTTDQHCTGLDDVKCSAALAAEKRCYNQNSMPDRALDVFHRKNKLPKNLEFKKANGWYNETNGKQTTTLSSNKFEDLITLAEKRVEHKTETESCPRKQPVVRFLEPENARGKKLTEQRTHPILSQGNFLELTEANKHDMRICVALYPYEPQSDDELTLNEKDIICITQKCDDGWFIGTSLSSGEFGTFPGNYVKML